MKEKNGLFLLTVVFVFSLTWPGCGHDAQKKKNDSTSQKTDDEEPDTTTRETPLDNLANDSRNTGIAYSGDAIIADHNAVTAFTNIPDNWLSEARKLRVHFAHTSHGAQIITGAWWLSATDSKYGFDRVEGTTPGLPSTTDVLRVYDGNSDCSGCASDCNGIYITPPCYWESPCGVDCTKTVLNTGVFDISMWAWCGQQSDNSKETVEQYLRTMTELEEAYPNIRFIYFTGHVDGTDTPNTEGTLKYNNNLVRDYVKANNKILYDFADIESWSPDGIHHPTASDACEWCSDWCQSHSEECAATEGIGSCNHSHKYNCAIKIKAFWWLMARLAGWSG